MKTVSASSEITAIANLCNGAADLKTLLLASLREAHFGVPSAKEVFNRVSYLGQLGKGIPSAELLMEDMSLSEEARDFLGGYRKCNKLKNTNEAKQLLAVLNEYRLLRICYECSKESVDILQAKTVENPSKIIELYEKAVQDARSLSGSDDELVHIGKEGNAGKLVSEIIAGKTTAFIKTGFRTFDRINGGFRRKGLIIIGASTSGGKSAMAVQLLINMYRQGYNVALVSLEMDHEEVLCRILSNISRVDSLDILCDRASIIERERMAKAWEEFDKIGREKNCRYSIYCPTQDVTIQDVCYGLARFKYDVLIVDYISLLHSELTEMWKSLGETARFMKLFAKPYNMVSVLLCQVNDEEKVRYSRAIKEHADNMWSWVYSAEIAEETGHIIEVDQQKARNQQRFAFKVKEQFNYMTLTDCEEAVDPLLDTGRESMTELKMDAPLEEF